MEMMLHAPPIAHIIIPQVGDLSDNMGQWTYVGKKKKNKKIIVSP
jgi:hypothetical protein